MKQSFLLRFRQLFGLAMHLVKRWMKQEINSLSHASVEKVDETED